jgi:hypothetical protein
MLCFISAVAHLKEWGVVDEYTAMVEWLLAEEIQRNEKKRVIQV